jgi:hypothetical protein
MLGEVNLRGLSPSVASTSPAIIGLANIGGQLFLEYLRIYICSFSPP